MVLNRNEETISKLCSINWIVIPFPITTNIPFYLHSHLLLFGTRRSLILLLKYASWRPSNILLQTDKIYFCKNEIRPIDGRALLHLHYSLANNITCMAVDTSSVATRRSGRGEARLANQSIGGNRRNYETGDRKHSRGKKEVDRHNPTPPPYTHAFSLAFHPSIKIGATPPPFHDTRPP